MLIRTIDETTRWLADRELAFRPATAWGLDHIVDIPERFHRVRFVTPSDARRQASVSHLLSHWFRCEGALLVMKAVALYEPHELEAFLVLRRWAGDDRWVDGVPGGATPAHEFTDGTPGDRRSVREHLMIMMAYTFEGYFVQANGRVILWAADGVIDLAAADHADLITPTQAIEALRLERF
jgi:hypothetical protein